jgi:mannose-6-phosphate isomerase-like protein (cupin superfamily)
MSTIDTVIRSERPDAIAPDGSEVRLLCRVSGASTAEFLLPPSTVSRAVHHRTVEEVWFILEGEGQIWRSRADESVYVALTPGTSVTIPVGTIFQFMSAQEPLRVLGVTVPPWPGDAEAVPADGPWTPTA